MGNRAGTPVFKAIAALAEYIVDGVEVLAPNGDLLVANHAALRLFKAESVDSIRSLRQRLERVRVVDAQYQPVAEQDLPAFAALRGERFHELERIYVDPASGEERTLLLSGAPVHDTDGQVAFALILMTDVTDRARKRRLLERELGAVEERFRLLLDELSELVLTRTLDGIVTHANRSVAAFSGGARESVIGRHVNDVFDFSSENANIVEEVTAHVRTGQPLSRLITMHDAEGRPHDIEYTWRLVPGAEGEPEILSVGRDVTSYVSRERQLSAENELMTALARATRRVFSDLNPRALVENVSRGARELVGGSAVLYAALSNETFVAVDDVNWPPGAGQPIRDDRLAQALLDGTEVQVDQSQRRVIVPIAGPDGAPRWVLDIHPSEACCATLEAALFAVELLTRNFAVAVRNATLYGELERQRASVVELNQMKSDLIAMLAHDFKGPLTAIAGYGQLLIDGEIGEPEEQRHALQTIVNAAMRLAGLARDTLALSALEESELTLQCVPLDVAKLVAEAIEPHRVQRDLRLTNECEPALVNGDPERLRQVFDNLVSNAIKYSPGGAPVDVLVRRDGAEVAVDVRDRGIGVPAAELEGLFARFARASNARKLGITGTGFGLYLAKQFVEKMDGRITVFSVEGHGSTFSVHLPLVESARQTAAPAGKPPPSKRVLVADDDEDVRTFIAHALRGAGYGVRAVADGAQALERLCVERFDAAVLDMDMPGFTGEEVRARLAESGGRRGVGLVLASGMVQHVPSGWDGFLPKPFLMKDLLAAVERALTNASS